MCHGYVAMGRCSVYLRFLSARHTLLFHDDLQKFFEREMESFWFNVQNFPVYERAIEAARVKRVYKRMDNEYAKRYCLERPFEPTFESVVPVDIQMGTCIVKHIRYFFELAIH